MSAIKSFFLGILAALFALFLELALSLFFPVEKQVYFFTTFSSFLVIAALCEEIVKYALICQVFSELEKKWYIILSGFFLGLGFSGTEIFLNYYSRVDLIKIPFYFLLGMIAVHIFTSLFAAHVVSQKENIWFSTIRVLILNTSIHVIYNLIVIYLL